MATEKPNVRVVPADDGQKHRTVLPAAALVQQHAATFEDFPPRQPPPDFNPQQMLERVLHAAAAQ